MSYSTQTGSFNVELLGTALQLVEASGMAGGGTAVLMRKIVGTDIDFYLEMYNGAGSLLGAQLNLRTLALNEAPHQNDFRILALSNGNVMVTYNKSDTSDSGVNNAYFFVVDQAGTKLVSDTQINTSSGPSLTRGLDLIELANGNIAFSFQLADNASYGTRVFKPDGSVVSAEAPVASTNGALTAIAANTDGSYIVTYSYTQSGIAKIDFKTYSSQGVELNAGNLYTDPLSANIPQWEVIGLSNGSYVFTYGSYDNWFVDPGANNEVTSTAKILTSGGLASAPLTVAGVGVGNIASVVNADGSKGFITLGVTNTPKYTWAQNGERELKLSLNYYTDAGVLVSPAPDVVSGSSYVLSYDAYSYPAAVLFAGKAQGTGLIFKQSPDAVSSNGTNLAYSLEAVLLDQALPPVVTVSTNNANIAEAAGVATITATLSAVAAADTIVTLSLAGTATGSSTDYTVAATSITVQAGQLTGTATLTAVQDTLDEDNETILVGVQSVTGGGGATAAAGQVTVTITDDDPAPAVSIAAASVAEGNAGTTSMVFTVSLGAASSKAITIGYQTSDGTATAGVDYTAASGTLSFAAGETSKQVSVAVSGDTVAEANETLTLTLSSPSNATLGTSSAVGTIVNDDNAAPVLITPTAIAFTDTAAADSFTTATGTLSATDSDGLAGYGVTGSSAANQVIGSITYDLSRAGIYGTLYLKASTGDYAYVPNATAINALGAGPQSETFTLTSTDSNASPATGNAVLTVNLTGANDTPTALTLSTSSVAQSGGANATVGNLSSSDVDTGQTFAYSLVAGVGGNDVDNLSFSIVGNTLRANSAGTLAAGNNKIVVRTTDSGGSTLDQAFTIVVVDDVAPVTTFSGLSFNNDTGTPGDFKTKAAAQTVSATLSAALATGERVLASVNGGTDWADVTTSVTGTQLSWIGVSLLPGTQVLQLKVVDAANNSSLIRSQTYVLDTTAPDVLITSPALMRASVISGTAEAGATLVLTVGGASYDVVSVGGAWQIDLATAVPATGVLALNTNGANAVSIVATDNVGNASTALNQTLVIDNTAPVAQVGSARVNGASLVLSYADTLALDALNLPAASAFTVKVDGATAAVNTMVVDALAKTVTLTLASAAPAGAVVTLAYADPSVGEDINAIQDALGNDAASFAAVAITNSTPGDTPLTPTAPTTMVDGVAILIGIGTDGYPQITVPLVSPTRTEDAGTANSKLADIPLVKNAGGGTLLNVGVPVGTGLTASGPGTSVAVDTARSLLDNRIPGGVDTAEMKAAAQAFLNGLPPGTQVVVQTIKLDAQASTGGPLMIGVDNTGDGHKTVLVIDASGLPAGTLIQLDNVDFAVIIGNARVTGGAGANIVYGDGGQQFIVLGEGDDILHGGSNDDTVGSLRGQDQAFGDGGNDVVYGGTGNDVLTGGAGNDRMNGGFGLDRAVQSGVMDDYTVTLDGRTVVLTHKISGEVDRFLDVEVIGFASGASLVVAQEAGDVAALTAQFVGAQLIELNANRAITGTLDRDELTPDMGLALNIDLGAGIDIVRLAGTRADVHIDVETGQRAELTRLSDGAMLALNQVEMLTFANGNVAVLAHNHAEAVIGRAYELLLARNVDVGGYAFWLSGVQAGSALNEVLGAMMRAPEYAGGSLSNSGFVDALYLNGLGRVADAGGKAFWLGALDAGVSRAQVLEGIASSKEAITVIGSTIDVTVVS